MRTAIAEATLAEPTLLLVRHAESEWNASGRWQGHGDPPLSERGRAQAAALARRIASQRVARIVSSDLRRAVETAAVIAEGRAVEPSQDARLRELDVGRWTGLTRREIEQGDPERLSRFESGDEDAEPGGGESRRALAQRAGAVVAELLEGGGEGLIVVVTHLGVFRALLTGIEPENAGSVVVRAGDLGV